MGRDGPRAVVLVEGDSDRIALETLARRTERDLVADRVTVAAMGGAHAIDEHLRRLGPSGEGARLAGLCDVGEEAVFRNALEGAGFGTGLDRAAMAALGFHVCVEDLEDELIRVVGQAGIEAVLAGEGDLAAFRTMQQQPAWRGEPFDRQMRRWMGAGARRKTRYARLLVEAVEPSGAPPPLLALLDSV